MGAPRAAWGRLHRATRTAAIAGALATGLALGPVAAATLLLRSPGSDGGAAPGAWVVVGAVVLLAMLGGGALLGAIVAGIRRLTHRDA